MAPHLLLELRHFPLSARKALLVALKHDGAYRLSIPRELVPQLWRQGWRAGQSAPACISTARVLQVRGVNGYAARIEPVGVALCV
jgi:hypothetical protein